MSSPVQITLDAVPSLPSMYAKALFLRRNPAPDAVVPAIEVTLPGFRFDATQLAAYNRVCGFEGAGVPITYPQVAATAIHAAALWHDTFPFPVLGLVHLRNEIVQQRPLRLDETFLITVRVEGSREVRNGREFDLHTALSVGGETPWRAITTVFSRQGAPAERREKPTPEPAGDPPGTFRSLVWRVRADQGRQYAGVSGDYNPIHLSAISAKPFGFPRAIVHGMWTLARCTAALSDVTPTGPVKLLGTFRRPVLLPSTVNFSARREAGAVAFDVRVRDGAMPLLSGSIGAA